MDYYEAFSLPREGTIEQLSRQLRVMRPGYVYAALQDVSDESRGTLVLIERALRVFSSERARECYDLALERARSAGVQPGPVAVLAYALAALRTLSDGPAGAYAGPFGDRGAPASGASRAGLVPGADAGDRAPVIR